MLDQEALGEDEPSLAIETWKAANQIIQIAVPQKETAEKHFLDRVYRELKEVGKYPSEPDPLRFITIEKQGEYEYVIFSSDYMDLKIPVMLFMQAASWGESVLDPCITRYVKPNRR
jgi:hypothetical protein